MLLGFFSGFISGIALASLFHISIIVIIFILVITGIIYLYKFFVNEEYHRILLVFTFVLLGVTVGVVRIYVSDLYTTSHLEKFVGQKISAVGIITDEPDVRETGTKLTVRLDEIFDGVATTSAKEKVLVTVPIYPEYQYGDKVRLQITLQEPSEIESSGRVFDYKGYLRVRGIWYTSRYTTIKLISSGHGSVIKTALFKIKNVFTESINNVLPQPESSLLAGLLLGTKQSLGKELLTEFQKTGVSHIVVLSGYNIAIVATSIMSLLSFILPKTNALASVRPTLFLKVFRPKNLSFGFGALSIILFTIASGGGASAWRAAIMVLVALFAKKMNRDYKISRVFGFTIILMLAPNPLLLVFDPSFQLSALATIGLIFVSPFVMPYLSWITEKFGLREIVSSTISTQVTVLPFLIYNMGVLSLVSLPINILILGTIPLTMLLGFITGIFGLFSLYISFIPAFFTYILLWYQLTIIHIGASIPLGSINLPSFSIVVLIFIYSLIFLSLFYLKQKELK